MAIKCELVTKQLLLESSKDINALKVTRIHMKSGTKSYKAITSILKRKERENDKMRICLGMKPFHLTARKFVIKKK